MENVTLDANDDEVTFDEKMDEIRIKIKEIAKIVEDEKKIVVKSNLDSKTINWGEIIANLTLSYRHLEDASMRIGKVKQHINGGVSIYDKNVVGSPE